MQLTSIRLSSWTCSSVCAVPPPPPPNISYFFQLPTTTTVCYIYFKQQQQPKYGVPKNHWLPRFFPFFFLFDFSVKLERATIFGAAQLNFYDAANSSSSSNIKAGYTFTHLYYYPRMLLGHHILVAAQYANCASYKDNYPIPAADVHL